MEGKRPQDVVAAGYDRIAARYAAWRKGIIGDPRDKDIERLLSQLPLMPDILEIGSGGGVEPTPTLARRGRLVGVDISIAQIERARASVPDGHFIRADILDTNFDDGAFDAVVALFVLTHIPTVELPAWSIASAIGSDQKGVSRDLQQRRTTRRARRLAGRADVLQWAQSEHE